MKYKLGDLGRVVTGKTPSTKNKNLFSNIPDKYLFVTPRDMNISTKRIFATERYLTDKVTESFKKLIIDEKSICVSCIGTIGKTFMPNGKTITNQQINSITDVKEFIVPEYLYYYLLIHQKEIENLAGGTTMPIVNKRAFEQLEVDVPDLETQKKVVRILSAFDEKIELNNQLISSSENTALTIFDDIFPKVIFGNKSVGDYISPKRGRSLLSKDTKDGKVPVIAGGLRPAAYHNEANTKAPVVTISASGANAGYVALWSTPVWSSDSSFIDETVSKNVYFWYAFLKKSQNRIYDSQTGSAQAHIYPKHIEELGISDISDQEIANYESKVKPIFSNIGFKKEQNETLRQLRDALLPKLMAGEINLDKVSV